MQLGPILLLEDDPILSTEICSLLRARQIEVSIAMDGEQFWAVFRLMFSKRVKKALFSVNLG
jgi:DNA-binding response OmpR family regulator